MKMDLEPLTGVPVVSAPAPRATLPGVLRAMFGLLVMGCAMLVVLPYWLGLAGFVLVAAGVQLAGETARYAVAVSVGR